MDYARPSEDFKPIPIKHGSGLFGAGAFRLRMVLDLQLLTCFRFLKPALSRMTGSVLDVGCGEMPFRYLLPLGCRYTGIDVAQADDFGMTRSSEIIAFDGINIPFPDASIDNLLCTEVLEHVKQPEALMAEMYRVLKPGGTLVATVPFAARVHHAPHDFHRFTPYRLADLFGQFDRVEINERGDDLAVIANKLIVVCMRLVRPSIALIWRLPLLVIIGPFAAIALAVAHLSLWLGWGSKSDPLGYGISAKKAG